MLWLTLTPSLSFCKPTPLRSLDEIRIDLKSLQAEAEGLLDEIVALAGDGTGVSE